MGKSNRGCDTSSIFWKTESRWTKVAIGEQVRRDWRKRVANQWQSESLRGSAESLSHRDVRGTLKTRTKETKVMITHHYKEQLYPRFSFRFPSTTKLSLSHLAKGKSFLLWKGCRRYWISSHLSVLREVVREAAESVGFY